MAIVIRCWNKTVRLFTQRYFEGINYAQYQVLNTEHDFLVRDKQRYLSSLFVK